MQNGEFMNNKNLTGDLKEDELRSINEKLKDEYQLI